MNKPQIVEVRDIAQAIRVTNVTTVTFKFKLEELGEVLQVTRCQLAASAILFLCVSELKNKIKNPEKRRNREIGNICTHHLPVFPETSQMYNWHYGNRQKIRKLTKTTYTSVNVDF